MSEVPEHVRELVAERESARAERDFARADALRDRIAAEGYAVRDTANGPQIERAARAMTADPSAIGNGLASEPTLRASLHVLYEGFPEDLARFLDAIAAYEDAGACEVVVVDDASGEADVVDDIVARHRFARAVHLTRAVGWAAARNAGLRTSAGEMVVLADLSIEPRGAVVAPLAEALSDPTVAVAGPFGLVSDDLRSWRDDAGPDVDAIEGYLLATRRALLADEQIDERFGWYRNADIDLSFQLRAAAGGGRAVVVPVAVARHTHRGWSAVPDDDRERRSRRNYRIFTERWGDRADLLRSSRGRVRSEGSNGP